MAQRTGWCETPDMFHRRVEQTLRILQTERTEACTTKSCLQRCSYYLPSLRFTGVLDFITNTEAKNWVLDDAGAMVHTEDGQRFNRRMHGKHQKWVCDGQRLFATIG